jgi:hypothetical protein
MGKRGIVLAVGIYLAPCPHFSPLGVSSQELSRSLDLGVLLLVFSPLGIMMHTYRAVPGALPCAVPGVVYRFISTQPLKDDIITSIRGNRTSNGFHC